MNCTTCGDRGECEYCLKDKAVVRVLTNMQEQEIMYRALGRAYRAISYAANYLPKAQLVEVHRIINEEGDKAWN